MTNDHARLYDALAARDARFDGMFFVGVTSTGIYCRPVCTARTPRASNCRFYPSAAAAEMDRFRPCLRCRPELAPGRAPVDGGQRVAARIADRISEGILDEGGGVAHIAKEFHFSERQIRRIVKSELGVSPIELVQTRRLLLAKQLLTETTLPVTEIAFASGFASLRRFNDAFARRYGMPPTRLRKNTTSTDARSDGADARPWLTLQMSYRAPYDWAGLLDFLRGRLLTDVEIADCDSYARTLQFGEHAGWIAVRNNAPKRALMLDVSSALVPVLPLLLSRVRSVFDLNARPDLIGERLAADPVLRDGVIANPGLRVPGAFDGFELALRAILGQQITVRAATTIAGRFTNAFGARIATPHAGLTRLAPTAARVAELDPERIAELGIIRKRAETIVAVAREIAAGRIRLEAGCDPDATIAQLTSLPGIGPWTANYIAMRALRWPDAFPRDDVAVRKRLGGVSAARADEMAEAWRPWRSYATLHVWRLPT